ncbi:MAG TPA: Uma2 family endonuclease [Aurantimonas sp.]|uniref:Uma2 family endonuclease n=1 Tax=Aurantimonas marianensis TaxID=2920428 RepID=A0A9X2H4V0_9HYPH|nr:Uma2 family endonuclease [Aurantimonas marianensis]MCP3053825.1 Uma2 family endonuclease [Aurantimonas marianensis]
MNHHSSARAKDRWDPARFREMALSRPREERWQLIDGEPFVMMSPATGKHQRIAANLDRKLTAALETSRPELDVLREIGLAVAAHPDFLPIVDLAIVPLEVGDTLYFEEFYLAAEILSPSNTIEHISRKRERYSQAPTCLYVLILSQTDLAVEVWSRSDDWRGRVFRSPDDRIELPEFGFSCTVRDLYRGTPLLDSPSSESEV